MSEGLRVSDEPVGSPIIHARASPPATANAGKCVVKSVRGRVVEKVLIS